MHDIWYGSAAIVGWVALAYKVRHLWADPRDRALRAVCAAFASSALAFTLVLGPVYQPLDALIGVPNLAKLLVHSAMVMFSVFVLQLLAFWERGATAARGFAHVIAACGVFVVLIMSGLIALAPIHGSSTIHFWKSHAGEELMFGYLAIFLGSLAVGMLAITHRAWRFSRQMSGTLRWSLTCTTWGAVIALGYVLCRGVFLVTAQTGRPVNLLVDIAIPFASIGQIMIFAGLTMPGWGVRLEEFTSRVQLRRAFSALGPLWSALSRANPHIVLHPSDGPELSASTESLEYRLYRRMVEIRDGQLALRDQSVEWIEFGFVPPANHPELQRLAEQEAARISAALDSRNARPTGEGTAAASPPAPRAFTACVASGDAMTHVGAPLGPLLADDELRWLVKVSSAFSRISER